MIYIIIPVHNRAHFTRQCLQCLRAQAMHELTVVVVDDGSTDGTTEMVQSEFPEVVLLPGDGSLWWAEGTNVGVRYALEQADFSTENFVLTLNDDTEVSPDYVASLVETYAAYKPCLVGSVSVDIDQSDRLTFAAYQHNFWIGGQTNPASYYGFSYQQLRQQASILESDSLPGRGVLIPMAAFRQIGLFDSQTFPHHMADLDFSIRARKAGFQLVVSTSSPVYEHTQATHLVLTPDLSWHRFRQSLTTRHSPLNLRIRYAFAMRHSPWKFIYFLFDLARILGGYCIRRVKWRINK